MGQRYCSTGKQQNAFFLPLKHKTISYPKKKVCYLPTCNLLWFPLSAFNSDFSFSRKFDELGQNKGLEFF